MSISLNIYSIITIVNLFLAVAIIFLERKNVGVTWAWVLVLFFLPGIGFLLYLLLGQNLRKRKLYKIKEEQEKLVNTVVENQKKQLPDFQFHDPSNARYIDLIYMNLVSARSVFTQDNEVEIFTDGSSKFASLFQSIEEAQDHIHLMYYIVQNDSLGRKLIDALAKKAKEGVEVRFLYDDIGTRVPKSFFQPLIEAGGKTSAFFPSRIPYLNVRVNYRNHRKMVIIDGFCGYIGGINVGNEYLGLNPRFGEWRDTHLKITGSAVLQMQSHFLLDWNLASADKIEEVPWYFPVENRGKGKVGVQIVTSGPTQQWEQIKNTYIKMIYAAKESVLIQTPYFIPDESYITALQNAALSGVNVTMMLPGKPDHKLVYWASWSYLNELLEAGVNCYLYEKGFLHAKTIVVDGKVASVGTANVDLRSFQLNFEVNAVLYDTATATKLQVVFLRDLENCRRLTMDEYRRRPIRIRFLESCARLLSPIL